MRPIERFIVGLVMSFLGAWFLMLGVGVIHHEWIPQCPTISYWWAFVVDLTIGGWLSSALYMTIYGSVQNLLLDLAKKK